jgi:hypothetical protein
MESIKTSGETPSSVTHGWLDFQQESVDNLLEGKDVYLSDFYLWYQRVSLS